MFARGEDWLRSTLTVLWLSYPGLFAWTVLAPAIHNNNSIAAFYTAAYLSVHRPDSFYKVYDNDWFAAQIAEVGFPGIYDVYNLNPPVTGLAFAPLLILPFSWIRIGWVALLCLALSGGLFILARTLGYGWRWILLVLPFCLLYEPVRFNFVRMQVYLVMFSAVCIIVWAMIHRKERLAGITSLILSAYFSRLHWKQLEARLLTLAMYLALVVTNTPFAEDYHYVLVLPSLLVAFWWLGCKPPGNQYFLLLRLAAVFLSNKGPFRDPHFTQGWWALLAYPRVYGAYLLWTWLLLQLHHLPAAMADGYALDGKSSGHP